MVSNSSLKFGKGSLIDPNFMDVAELRKVSKTFRFLVDGVY